MGGGIDFSDYLSRMTTLTITDEIGMDSDKFEITLDDDDPEHELPEKDVTIDVYIGWENEGLVHKGTYKYDSATPKGPLRTLTLHFTAADMKGSLKARRSESYHETTLKDIGEKVAKRSGLKIKFLGDVGEQKVPHEDQTAESDMAFLLRLATDRDLFAKPSFGQIVIGKPGSGKETKHTVDISEISAWSAVLQARGSATEAKARVDDLEKGESRYVTEKAGGEKKEGAKDVTRELLQGHLTDEEAKAAAKADLESQNRGTGTIQVEMPGDPKFFAEHHIDVKRFSIKVNGDWRLTSVVDTISSSSWTTSLSGERGADVMKGKGDSDGEVVQFPVEGGGQTPAK